jgi:hypothetical protein
LKHLHLFLMTVFVYCIVVSLPDDTAVFRHAIHRGTGSFNSCDALLKRVEENDPTLIELVILSMKTFGAKEVERLAAALASGQNTHLQTISASGHAIPPESLRIFGAAIASGKSNLKNLAIGDSKMGDDGVCALCQGLASTTENQQLESIDLSYKGM